MTVERKEWVPAPFGELGRSGGTRWYNGRTWHVTIAPEDRLASEHYDAEGRVECYEIEWDNDGQGRPTGNRRSMTVQEAALTQVEECPKIEVG